MSSHSPPLRSLLAQFAAALLASPEINRQRTDADRRKERASRLLTRERLPALEEPDVKELFFDTRAFGFWSDREGEWRRRLERVGFETLRSTLEFLIHRAEEGLSPDDLREIQSNTGLGLLLSTELATYRFPDRCWIFSSRVTPPAIEWLGWDIRHSAPFGRRSDPYLYAAAADAIQEIRESLSAVGIEGADNTLVDLFLGWIYHEHVPARQARIKASSLDKQPPAREQLIREAGIAYETVDAVSVIRHALVVEGLAFTAWQIAAFYTALQVKGFVILTGISGVGKTRLVQSTAALLDVSPQDSAADPGESTPGPCVSPNLLFLPVRPDWRDSKSLLGYHNPLSGQYEWTDFLRFLMSAAASFEARDGRAWFVLLDEMNLARVEYYFADLLSVLESGRSRDGWTREALRFTAPAVAEGPYPPTILRLPPNLFIVGTVNTDETTHSFSARVLDRAFALTLGDVDFAGRIAAEVEMPPVPLDLRRSLLRSFTSSGSFPRLEGHQVSPQMDLAARLQRLTDLLQPYDLHFGYRVFDEIAAFVRLADENRTFQGAGDFAALDAAALMKALPKFHGSRGRLERPLRLLLAWCRDPDSPDHASIDAAFRAVDTAGVPDAAEIVDRELGLIRFRLPATAARARDMMRTLYAEGFASSL